METWHYAQVRAAFRTVILCFPAEGPAALIARVPAKVATEWRTGTYRGRVARTVRIRYALRYYAVKGGGSGDCGRGGRLSTDDSHGPD
ncbi:jg23747 [Pararge aegeria aegeria]|uniref:Jg23747 protein n=1 Tax=Pararge aegeria aegeria TaxID=348720 RepID=A0A8S4QF09_9NEOP|nr:jg23747 [Pararge aegeria aegeria]